MRMPLLFLELILCRLAFLATCVQAEIAGAVYIFVAIAAALCGYVSSINGLIMSSLVTNFETEQMKRLFMNRLEKVLLNI